MSQIEEIRAALLKACDERYSEVLWQNRGCELPDTGKLIREGIRAAWKIIEETPVEGTPGTYLDALKERIDAAADEYRRHPISQDGWHDEDSYIVGGINTIRNEVEKIETDAAGLLGRLKELIRGMTGRRKPEA